MNTNQMQKTRKLLDSMAACGEWITALSLDFDALLPELADPDGSRSDCAPAEALARLSCPAPDTLTYRELDALLGELERVTQWISDVRAYALSQALSGVEYSDFKLVESRTKRKYTDEAAAAGVVAAAGYDPYEKSVRGVTAMTRLLGTEQFEALLGHLTFRPRGNPILVPRSDNRPELSRTGGTTPAGDIGTAKAAAPAAAQA